MRKFINNFRKYLIGAIAGAALMFGIQAGASDFLSGSKVAGTKDVTYNGNDIGQAAIINNSSFLPVRAIADAIGAHIDLSGGKINLSDNTVVTTPDEPSQSLSELDSLNQQLNDVLVQLKPLDAKMKEYFDARSVLDNQWMTDVENRPEIEEQAKAMDEQYKPYLDQRAALVIKRNNLQKQIQELEEAKVAEGQISK